MRGWFRAELCTLSPGPADAAKANSWPWALGPPGLSSPPFEAHLGKGDEEELVVRVFHVVQGVLGAMFPHPLLVGLENKGCSQHGLDTPPNPP